MQGTIDFKVNLAAQVQRDGDVWVAWCPALDVYGQGDTKPEAMKSLEGSVMAWFESCLERGVLPGALTEVGFRLASSVAGSGNEALGTDRLEVLVPGYVAAALSAQAGNASR